MHATPALPARIGIVVLNWNGCADTLACIASTKNLTYANYQLYVVDNASTDGSEAILRAAHPDVCVLQSGGNLGWSGGNNVGIRRALADGCAHVYLLNNDATVLPDTLSLLADAAVTLPEAAALGSLVVAALNPAWVEFAGTDIDPITHHPRQHHGWLRDVDTTAPPAAMPAVKGCSMLLTGAALAKIGLLAEDYFLNYDETDWCYRATAAGFTSYFVPASAILHQGAVAFGGTTSPLYRYFITRNRLVFAHRHLDRHGRRFAWRGALWEVKQALLLDQPPGYRTLRHRLLLVRAIALGVRDYSLRRLGDCPATVRVLHRRYTAAVR